MYRTNIKGRSGNRKQNFSLSKKILSAQSRSALENQIVSQMQLIHDLNTRREILPTTRGRYWLKLSSESSCEFLHATLLPRRPTSARTPDHKLLWRRSNCHIHLRAPRVSGYDNRSTSLGLKSSFNMFADSAEANRRSFDTRAYVPGALLIHGSVDLEHKVSRPYGRERWSVCAHNIFC